METVTPPYMPFEPFERYVEVFFRPEADNGATTEVTRTTSSLAQLLGVNRGTLSRQRSAGAIPYHTADLYATRLGTHPTMIWPEFHDFTEVIDD